ncbi:unnamed protein product [Phytomonas sp. EM1]|nr:unnamed protein product [Phytomonas sp. EM1]|eukprot:CCW62947.1 unnamed protein product [Phytomonas sp. isolate EM1]
MSQDLRKRSTTALDKRNVRIKRESTTTGESGNCDCSDNEMLLDEKRVALSDEHENGACDSLEATAAAEEQNMSECCSDGILLNDPHVEDDHRIFGCEGNSCISVPMHRLLSEEDEGDDDDHRAGEVEMGLDKNEQGENASLQSSTPASHKESASRTRLVISHIDVENFKSYYGQHRIGPFHKTFSAVIGPNGSGKSNVIDSMLFVFGRSARKIRLEKLSEVIHNSAAHPDVSYASVTVCFVRVKETLEEATDPTQREEVKNSELRITREVFRSGVSQYYIDGVRQTQKSVMECLIQHGVDLEHNRFLILQGEVEQIALMKPKAEKEGEEGLLEYLDDLIGTSDYVERISAATRSAEAAQLERLDALDREHKLRAEREALDDAKNSTMAFVIKDNQLQKTLIVMCQLRMRGIEERLAEPRRLLEEIDSRIGTLQEDLDARREAKLKAEEEISQRKKEVTEVLKERDAVRTKKQNCEVLLEKLKSSAQDQERTHLKVVEQIEKFKNDVQEAQMLQQDAEREAAIHQQNYDEAIQDVSRLQTSHDELSLKLLPQLRPLRQELDEKKKLFAPYDRAVTEATEQLNSAQQRLNALHELKHEKLQQLQQTEQSASQHSVRIEELNRIVREAEGSEHRDELLRMQDLLTESTQRKYAINSLISELKNAYREGEADDRAMEFLLSQRNLKGYYGTLRQLGRIDDAYDVAAGVASNAWGFHVVEDRATATAALEALKRNNMGRATMMVISEVTREVGERMQRPFAQPNPKAKRLFDLIKPTNEKFRPVFYQAVRDTMVVSTLAEARETAFHSNQRVGGHNSQPSRRFRVVTLKGELVEPSGVITGGGNAPRGAKLKAARSPQDKLAVKEELQRLQQELVQAAEEERAAQLRLHQLRETQTRLSPEQVRRLKAEQRTLSVTMDHELARIQTLKQEYSRVCEEEKEKHLTLQDAVDACQKRLLRAKQTREEHHHDIEALEARIEEAGGETFRDLTETLKKVRDTQEAEEVALRECRRRIQKLRAKQERVQRDILEREKRLMELKAEDESGSKEKIAQCTVQVKELEDQLHTAEEALAKAQASSNNAKAAMLELNSALSEAQAKLEDEKRYRRTQSAKMADALQELAKFAQKIEGCEEKIKENAELYGIETLQLEGVGDENSPDDGDTMSNEEQDEEGDDNRRASFSKKKHSWRRRHTNRGDADENDDDSRQNNEAATVSMESGASHITMEQVKRMSFRLQPEELDRCDYERSVHLAKTLSEETKRLHSEIDFRAVALWRERDVAHREALAVYEAKKHTSDELEGQLNELKHVRRKAFMEVFENIRKKLKEVYQYLTHGGDADMELMDVNDPFAGILFVVRPPKKSWKQISNLSGGEKTLSSLALIFALHHIKPTPIYVMDEIDAALDFRNVSIVSNYVLRQATDAQFIIISLRNNMFEMAHQLVGVCKVKDVTATFAFMPRRFERVVRDMLLAKQMRRRSHRLSQEEGGRPKSTHKVNTTSHGSPPKRNDTQGEVTKLSNQNNVNISVVNTKRSSWLECATDLPHDDASHGVDPEESMNEDIRRHPPHRKSVRFSDECVNKENTEIK